MKTERITRIALLTPMAVIALIITAYAQPRNHVSSDKIIVARGESRLYLRRR
jgi:hypothetical protein